MDRDPPDNRDPRQPPRIPRWTDPTWAPEDFPQSPGFDPSVFDSEETRPMPTGDRAPRPPAPQPPPPPPATPPPAPPRRNARRLSESELPPPVREPGSPRRGAGRLNESDLPTDIRGAPPPRRGAGRLSEDDLPPDVPGAAPPAAEWGAFPPDPGAPSPPAPRWGGAQPPPGEPPPPGEAAPAPRVSRSAAASPSAPAPRAPRSGATRSRQRSIAPPAGRKWVQRRRIILAALALVAIGLCAWLGPLFFKGQALISDIFVTPPPRPSGVSAYPDWNKQERVNILLMGLDTRQPGDSRSDTLILVSIDPAHKTVAMLSIPRDLWVPIPGFGENRINAAYQYGETNNVPGGGPALVMQTVEQDFAVPVHYFAQVDFNGFRRIVDALGGVTVDVQRPLIDNEYPADYGYAYQRVYIPAGLQHMDGRTALQYVRSRHADSDLARNERQQAVLIALRAQGTQISILGKLDKLFTELKGAMRTDLSVTQVGSLVKLAQSIPRDQVRQLSVGADMVAPGNMGGADVLLPQWDVIRPAVRQLLGQADLTSESAVLSVQNGTDTPGLALRTAEQMRGAGFQVPDSAVGNPPDGGGGHYPQTFIYDYTGGKKPASISRILALLKLPADRVRTSGGTHPAGIDIEIVLGEDAAK